MKISYPCLVLLAAFMSNLDQRSRGIIFILGMPAPGSCPYYRQKGTQALASVEDDAVTRKTKARLSPVKQMSRDV
ncbi:hypothetical protein F4779DRAFT_599169 [Xylariaceae sp. FL0662B]|nr:hypothetical protein F4779DRAFT_599169 [Xylariaceae sp. FL0662B]